MVFKGTKNRSAEQIARSVDSIGGGLDAFTSKELVSYNVKVLDEHLPRCLRRSRPTWCAILFFEKKDIEKEKGVILEELKMEVDNPEYLIHEIFSSNFWKGHSLGRPILGTQADHPQLRPRQRGALLPALLHAEEHSDHGCGKSDAQATGAVWREEHFGELKRRDACPRPTARPQPHAPLVFREKNSLEQVHVYMGVPSIADAAPDRGSPATS